MYYLQWNSKNLDHVNQGFWRITVHSLAWLNWWAKISWHRPFKLIKYSMFSGIFCFIQQKDSAVRLCTYLSYMYSVYCSGRGSKTVYNVFYFGRFSFLLTADHQREVVNKLYYFLTATIPHVSCPLQIYLRICKSLQNPYCLWIRNSDEIAWYTATVYCVYVNKCRTVQSRSQSLWEGQATYR